MGDFGLCRDLSSDSMTVTRSNTVVGTVAYMAPEQFDNAHLVGPEADVFALGRILHHMLTGKCPFPYARIDQVPSAFKYLVAHATEEEPQNRYSSVAEFSRQLGLVTGLSDTMAAPTEVGKTLLAEILNNPAGAKVDDSLLKHVLDNAGDEVFYHEFVASLPAHILAAFQAASPQGFADIVKTFDEYSEGSHPFSHVDVIVDFFVNVMNITGDLALRRLAFRRIVTIGHKHGRFYVQEVVRRIVGKMTDPQDILLAADVLKDSESAAIFYRPRLEELSLPPAIRNALAQAS